jgi:hypothetical protein
MKMANKRKKNNYKKVNQHRWKKACQLGNHIPELYTLYEKLSREYWEGYYQPSFKEGRLNNGKL